jgi:hypothetical protein
MASFNVGNLETSWSATALFVLVTGSCYPLILNIKWEIFVVMWMFDVIASYNRLHTLEGEN